MTSEGSIVPPMLPPEDLATCMRVLEALVHGGELPESNALQRIRSGAHQLCVAGCRGRREARKRVRRMIRRGLAETAQMATERRVRRARKRRIAPDPDDADTEAGDSVSIRCYVCKGIFAADQMHDMYGCLCGPCGEFNMAKRGQTADLRGYIAVVSGGRIKIGYQICLKLLRAGCTIIATTRFATDAIARYSAEADFGAWRDRLHIAAVDFLNGRQVGDFCNAVLARFPKIDILINNAAQTIWRPPEFYAHLLQTSCPGNADLIMDMGPSDQWALRDSEGKDGPARGPRLLSPVESEAPNYALAVANCASPAMANYGPLGQFFPAGRLDEHGQALDLRTRNSWTDTLETAPVGELLEDLAVNCAVPFLLIQKLTPAMSRVPPGCSFVVNVTAMEGIFHQPNKSSRHPASNMAKAAMNMITRTAGRAYWRQHRISMNSVDTGFITSEFPVGHPHHLTPPLDEIDGASRVLDPIFGAAAGREVICGLMLKDYTPHAW